MDGFLLDVVPGPGRGEVTAWVAKAGGGAVGLRERFAPSFFVRGPRAEVEALRRDVALVPGVLPPEWTTARCGLEDDETEVLRVPVEDGDLLPRLARLVDGRGGHRDLELFDVDLRLSQRWTIAKNLFPLAKVRAWGSGRYTLRDEQWAIAYEPPPLSRLHLDATPACERGEIATLAAAVRSARLGEETFEGREEDVLAALADAVRRADPDVLTTTGGDTFLLPWLVSRAKACGLAGFTLGRAPGEGAAADPGVAQKRKARSFFTYGKIKHQPAVVAVRGRIHLDLDSSFFFQEAGLYGLIDLARVSNIPLGDVARLGAGTAITAIQIDVAKRERRLIPWKKADPEPVKTARDLLNADRGGYILEPKVGVEEDVVEFDFASLYPNIMVTRNLSPETVQCACCRDDAARAALPVDRIVPQVGYHVCARREGFIPRSLRPVIRRREAFKRMKKERPHEAAKWKELSDAYKWLLVCSFGYQGYKNAKFGRIDCHESISAWGRDILLSAIEVARDAGYEPVHGIVDSLWLKRTLRDGTTEARRHGERPGSVSPCLRGFEEGEIEQLAGRVEKEAGIRFEYQGRYQWIVFLPTRSHNSDPDGPVVGALNRYYGCFTEPIGTVVRSNAGQRVQHGADPRLKVRGVELCQRSTPPFLCEAQKAMLNELAPARDRAEFLARVPAAVRALAPLWRRLLDGEVPLAQLVWSKATTKEPEAYRVWNETRCAAWQLLQAGVRTSPGESVRYVVLDEAARDPARRVRPVQLLRGGETYDPQAYARHFLRCAESLLLPVGWTAARVADELTERRQLTLSAFA